MPIKILFLTHRFYPDIGGIEVNSEILAHGFMKAGHEVRLVTWTKDAGTKRFPFPVFRNPNKLKLFQEHAWADVVFENNCCLRLAWPGLFFRRPSVIALRQWLGRNDGRMAVQDKVKKIWLKRASKVISVSDAVRKADWTEAIVIGNPYRVEEFCCINKTNRKIGFVLLGRLVSDKGTDLAIRAMHRLLTLPVAREVLASKPLLTIIGDGPERTSLEWLVKELHLEEYVHFAGSLRGVILVRCLNRHRFILVPSTREAFGNVVLEGMACGNLPIVSDSGGLPEAVGNSGLVFRSGDVNDLVACISRLLENPDLEKELRMNASAHLAEHHPHQICRRYLDVIEDAVERQK